MLMNLLTSANLPEGYQKVKIDIAALYALIGYAVVFAGIAFLIFVVIKFKICNNFFGNY